MKSCIPNYANYGLTCELLAHNCYLSLSLSHFAFLHLISIRVNVARKHPQRVVMGEGNSKGIFSHNKHSKQLDQIIKYRLKLSGFIHPDSRQHVGSLKCEPSTFMVHGKRVFQSEVEPPRTPNYNEIKLNKFLSFFFDPGGWLF